MTYYSSTANTREHASCPSDAYGGAQIMPQHLVQPGLENLSEKYSWFPPVAKVGAGHLACTASLH